MNPVVSILIPCHNAAPWLADTLGSAFAQTWPHKEIILVDDGSTDGSLAVARRYEPRGLRILTQPNSGAPAARNTALAAASGDWIQYLDADDLLSPEKISRQLTLAATLGPGYVLCCAWTRFTHTPADADHTPQPLCTDADPVDWVVTNFEQHAMMHPAAWLVPRALSDRVGPWLAARSPDDDGEYFNRIVLASRGVRHCPTATTYYRSNLPGSLSKTRTDAAWTAVHAGLELRANRLLAAEDSPRTRHACATAYQRFIYEAYPAAPEARLKAAARVAALGGSGLAPDYGPRFRLARRLLGWRLAKRLLLLSRRA